MKGIAVSKGVAIGKAYLLDSTKFCIIKHQISEPEAEKEVERFRQAIEGGEARRRRRSHRRCLLLGEVQS